MVSLRIDEDLKEKIKERHNVHYPKYVGDEDEMDGKKYRILQNLDIIIVVVD